jgi:hypothetical protein
VADAAAAARASTTTMRCRSLAARRDGFRPPFAPAPPP